MEGNNINYYDVGTVDKPVISPSSLSCLDPTQGGSIQRFLNFFRDREEEEEKKTAKDNGKLIHTYIEHPDEFFLSDIEEPTEMMAKLCKEFFRNVDKVKVFPDSFRDVDIEITSSFKKEADNVSERLMIGDRFLTLADIMKTSKEDVIACLREARIRTNSYKSYGEAKLLENILKESKYLEFLQESNGKIILTSKDKAAVEGAVNSINTNRNIKELMHLGTSISSDRGLNEKVFIEVPIFWNETVAVLGDTGFTTKLSMKSKLDRIILDLEARKIKVIDLKSTGSSLYLYQISFERYRTYRQLAIYGRAIKFWLSALYPDLDVKNFDIEFIVVVVETTGMYLSGIYNIPDAWIMKGADEARALWSRYAWHEYFGVKDKSFEEYTSSDGRLTLAAPNNNKIYGIYDRGETTNSSK